MWERLAASLLWVGDSLSAASTPAWAEAETAAEPELAAEADADAKPELVAEADAEAKPELAAESEAQAEVELPVSNMLGPYGSLEQFCAQLSSVRIGEGFVLEACLPSGNNWDTGERRGWRGPFEHAQLLRVAAHHGPHPVEMCFIALQTQKHWFVSTTTRACKGPTPLGQIETSLRELRWAEELGMGVLSVQAKHTLDRHQTSWRWWGELAWKTTLDHESLILCGMGKGGSPQCTSRLVANCEQLAFETRRGLLIVPQSSPMWPDFPCERTLLAEGRYRLPFEDAALSPRRSLAEQPGAQEDYPSYDSYDAGKAVAIPAYGPFPSVESYCEDVPSFRTMDAEMTDQPSGGRCVDSPRFHGKLGPNGKLRQVQLLNVAYPTEFDSDVHHCRIALRTQRGWFFTRDDNTCEWQGPLSVHRTQSLPPRWFSMGGRPVALIDTASKAYPIGPAEEFEMQEFEREEAPPTAPKPPPTNGTTPGQASPIPDQGIGPLESAPRVLRVCSVGPSGYPSCSPWLEAGCASGDGQTSHTVRFTKTGIEIIPKKLPQNTHFWACELPHSGKLELEFP